MGWDRSSQLVGWGAAAGLVLGCGTYDPAQAVGEASSTGATTEIVTSVLDASSSSSVETGNEGSTHGTADGDSGTAEPLLGPPYPIVLCHGFFGFEDFAGVDFVNYYFGVVDHLESEGEVLVFTPAVDPFNDSTIRGEQLLAEVEAILAETGHAKVNLVGHSQGGLDARVVAHLRPDLVASVTTIATPHYGTPIADIVLGLAPSADAEAVVDALLNLLGGVIWDRVDGDSSLAASLHQLSTPGIEAFNAMYPDAVGVLYQSIGGRTDWHAGGEPCMAASPPAFITDFEQELDPVDAGLSLTEELLDGSLIDPAPNDGLVLVEDSKWGDFLGCIPADHLDEIGHLLGDGPGWPNDWTHLTLYTGLVDLLRQQGL